MPGLGRQKAIDVFDEPLKEVFKSVSIHKARLSRKRKRASGMSTMSGINEPEKSSMTHPSTEHEAAVALLLLSRSGDKVTLQIKEVAKEEEVVTLSSDNESDEDITERGQSSVSDDPDWFEPEVLLIESDRRPVTRSLSRKNDSFKRGLLTSDKDPMLIDLTGEDGE